VTIIRSQKGGQKLCAAGFSYTRQTDNRATANERRDIRWRCVERLPKCRGTAITDLEMKQCNITISHNHPVSVNSTTYATALEKM